MIRGKKLVRYLAPHIHQDGSHHRAHAIGVGALLGYLQVLVLVTLALYFLRVGGAQILGVAQFSAAEIVEATNNRRIENGLPPLSVNEKLSEAARAKASDIYANNYWAHNSPSGKTPWDFIGVVDYKYIFAGENLARDFSDAASVVRAWMASPTHRANLLDKNFAEIGVAVASGRLGAREGTLVVQMFGASKESPSLAEVFDPEAQTRRATEGKPESTPLRQGSAGQVVESSQSEALVDNSVTVLASRHLAIAKTVSLALIGLVFGLFLVEIWVSTRRVEMSQASGVFAHLAILGFVLLAVWYAAGGAIL